MAKKEPTEAIHVRLPKLVIADLDNVAKGEFLTRSGMAARIIIESLKTKAKPIKPKK